jgi:hypothetical protein
VARQPAFGASESKQAIAQIRRGKAEVQIQTDKPIG